MPFTSFLLLASIACGFRGAPTITTTSPNIISAGDTGNLLAADGSVSFSGLATSNPSSVDAPSSAQGSSGPVTTPTPYKPMTITVSYQLAPVVSGLGAINYTLNYTDQIAAIQSLPVLQAFLDSQT